MKVLLVNPPLSDAMGDLRLPSIGLCHLARIAEDAGCDVEILDGNSLGMSVSAMAARVKEKVFYDIIGFTITTPILGNAVRLAHSIRGNAGWLIEGGAHISAMVREGANTPSDGFDIAFPGEADASFAAFIGWAKDVRPGTPPPAGLCRGVLVRGRPLVAAEPVSGELITRPAWHLLDPEAYSYPLAFGRPVMPMFTSRGCPFSCIFCDHSVFGHRIRYYPLEKLFADIEEVAARGIRYIIFFDDHFSLDHERLREICRFLIDRNLGVSWKCEGRAGSFTPELLSLMRRAGCECIALGIESGNQASLDFLRKGTTICQIRKSARIIREAGIRLLGYFILGIPGETWSQAMNTVRFAREIRCDYAQFSTLSPYPGTELAAMARKNGWMATGKYGNPYDAATTRTVISAGGWTPERLERLMRIAHLKFYASPRYIAQRLFGISGLRELSALARSALGLFGSLVPKRPSDTRRN